VGAAADAKSSVSTREDTEKSGKKTTTRRKRKQTPSKRQSNKKRGAGGAGGAAAADIALHDDFTNASAAAATADTVGDAAAATADTVGDAAAAADTSSVPAPVCLPVSETETLRHHIPRKIQVNAHLNVGLISSASTSSHVVDTKLSAPEADKLRRLQAEKALLWRVLGSCVLVHRGGGGELSDAAIRSSENDSAITPSDLLCSTVGAGALHFHFRIHDLLLCTWDQKRQLEGHSSSSVGASDIATATSSAGVDSRSGSIDIPNADAPVISARASVGNAENTSTGVSTINTDVNTAVSAVVSTDVCIGKENENPHPRLGNPYLNARRRSRSSMTASRTDSRLPAGAGNASNSSGSSSSGTNSDLRAPAMSSEASNANQSTATTDTESSISNASTAPPRDDEATGGSMLFMVERSASGAGERGRCDEDGSARNEDTLTSVLKRVENIQIQLQQPQHRRQNLSEPMQGQQADNMIRYPGASEVLARSGRVVYPFYSWKTVQTDAGNGNPVKTCGALALDISVYEYQLPGPAST
jgi:hypothetical protein